MPRVVFVVTAPCPTSSACVRRTNVACFVSYAAAEAFIVREMSSHGCLVEELVLYEEDAAYTNELLGSVSSGCSL